MEIEDQNQNEQHQIDKIILKDQMLSLKTLLIQALNNKDLNLVKFIIHNEKLDIINSTLQNFTEQSHYDKFIKMLFDLLESFPSECKYALKWLQIFLVINNKRLNYDQRQLLKSKREFLLKKKAMIKNLQNIQIKSKILLKVTQENRQQQQNMTFGEPLVYIDETKNQIENTFIQQYEQQQQETQEMFFNIPKKEEDLDEQEEELMYENAQRSQDKDDKYEMYFDDDENENLHEDNQEENYDEEEYD